MSEQTEKVMTKFERFVSKTGVISKIIDYKLENLPTSPYGYLMTNIRRLLDEEEGMYFYRLEDFFSNEYSSYSAMIAYSDLVEINKALVKLATDFENDKQFKPDYLENRFITQDGFIVGYYVSPDETNWFVKLERGASKNPHFEDYKELISHFNLAQKKIEELMDTNK